MKKRVIIEIMLKRQAKKSKVKPFDQALKNLGVILSQHAQFEK